MKRLLLLGLSIVFLFSFVLAGCGPKTPEVPKASDVPTATASPAPAETTKAPDATTVPVATAAVVEYKESPYFAGKGLPAVKDRLPKEPKITNEMPEDQLTYEIGTYGGTLRTVTAGVDWDWAVFCASNEPLINSPGILGKEFTGNVLKGFEMSADQKEFTFHMREGLKWSDGTPATAKDVQFAIDDVLFNKELTPIFPGWLCSAGVVGGTPVKFTMVDDFTFKFTFDKAYGGFVLKLSLQGWRAYNDLLKPSAFLKPFHKKYADPTELEAKITAAKFKPGEWVNLFNFKDISNWSTSSSRSIGFPSLCAWLYTKKTETTSEFERNPYYFKVDPAGNQLPYIDKIVSTFVQDMEVVNMKIISGEVDFNRDAVSINKMPLYKQNEAKGAYKVYMTNNHITPTNIILNLTFKNDNWRKVVQDERFRKALNMGINRKEIIDTAYFGFAEPSAVEDTTYDVAAANKLLDEMGMTKGADGFRKGPDGKKFTIPFEIAALAPDIITVTQLFVEQWKALGLDVTMKTIDGSLWSTRNDANQLQATVYWLSTSLWYMEEWLQGMWGPLWRNYYNSAGAKGEKPPADVQKLYDLCTGLATVKLEDGMADFEKIKAEFKTHNWFLIPLSNVRQPVIVNAKIGNVSDKGFDIAVGYAIEQLFFKK